MSNPAISPRAPHSTLPPPQVLYLNETDFRRWNPPPVDPVLAVEDVHSIFPIRRQSAIHQQRYRQVSALELDSPISRHSVGSSPSVLPGNSNSTSSSSEDGEKAGSQASSPHGSSVATRRVLTVKHKKPRGVSALGRFQIVNATGKVLGEEFFDFVVQLIDKHLDRTKSFTQQDAPTLAAVEREVLHKYPDIDTYEDRWPLHQFIRSECHSHASGSATK
ncbi:hypothetical protein VNI00_018056 [Paramarasmius palmivorus]|uniref:Uncharacterized protein n=1 Tax=Paramarasmius palmivorus TaxID=297713 RepID=A0AAW0B174_9AGAR